MEIDHRKFDSDATAALVTVSCASSSFCVGGDGFGDAYIYNGARWSAPTLVTRTGFAQISCPTATFCGAVDTNGDFWSLDGTAWSKPGYQPGSSQALFVSCPSAGICMAADGVDTDIWRLSNDAWAPIGRLDVSTPQGGSEPNVASGISCPEAAFCAALDDFGEAFTWQRDAWSQATSFDPNLADDTDAVSCASDDACVLVDDLGRTARWHGHTWTGKRRIDGSREGLSDVSCPTAHFCVAVDLHGRALTYR